MNLFYHIGAYFLLLKDVFGKPEKHAIYRRLIIHEIYELGIKSLGIVALLSVFMGAVITLQTASNIDSPLIPLYTVGFAARQSIILEFSPTIISLILSGKVGSYIASQIGSMRVTEQIDALEIMGVNSAGYLILPKIAATMFINPFLIVISMFLAITGGWLAGVGTGLINTHQYIYGLQFDFKVFSVFYALTKTVVFGFLIASVSAYHGYNAKGGALEVGNSSTKAVVYSIMTIIISNYILTQLILI